MTTTSGPTQPTPPPPDDQEIIDNVRGLAGTPAGTGLGDAYILDGVRGFVEAFEFWYVRVVQKAVPKYRNLLIARINPFIRRIELEEMGAGEAAAALVGDWQRRNFVTAGGWAIEEMAVRASPTSQKSAAEGIDIQRQVPGTSEYHLYVLKSGMVTRNSDIVSALKRNARQAERLLHQGRGTVTVKAHWAVAAGKTSSTFEDGIYRPSSADFWSQMIGLPENQAIDTVLAIAAEAGRLVKRDASAHLDALTTLVAEYISDPDDPGAVDWDFVATRNMRPNAVWRTEDRDRHLRALAALKATGYGVERGAEAEPAEGAVTQEEAERAAQAAMADLAGELEEKE